MSGASPGVSVVVPALNEEAAIGRELRAIAAAMSGSGWLHEIIVVDDGSTDSTARIAEEQGARVLRLERNCGYGAALKSGIDAAQYLWILITDADGTYPAEQIPALLARAPNVDMAVGARTGADVHIPWKRRPARKLLGWYANWVSGRRIPDLNSGLRLMRRAVIYRYWDVLPSGFSFTSTITLAMLTTGHAVEYHPIDYRRRIGRSKIRAVDFFRILRLITRMALRFRPLRLLLPAGCLAAGASAVLPFGAWWTPLLFLTAAALAAGPLERRALAERSRQ